MELDVEIGPAWSEIIVSRSSESRISHVEDGASVGHGSSAVVLW